MNFFLLYAYIWCFITIFFTCGGDRNRSASEGTTGCNTLDTLPVSFGVISTKLRWLILLLQGSELLLSFTAFGGGNPSALNVGLALKPSTLAAGSASEVRTVFLGLVATVLTVHAGASSAATHAASGPHDREAEAVGLIRERDRNVVVYVVGGAVVVVGGVVSATRAHAEGVVVGEVVVVRGLWPYLEALVGVVDLVVNVSEQKLTVVGVVVVVFSVILVFLRFVMPSS